MSDPKSFQERVQPWMIECFGEEITLNKDERNFRFCEESLELVQAGGMTKEQVLRMVDYVYGRPVGELAQEVGGVQVTLATLCTAHNIDLNGVAETELARVWTKVDKIRAKQAAKPNAIAFHPNQENPCAAIATEISTMYLQRPGDCMVGAGDGDTLVVTSIPVRICPEQDRECPLLATHRCFNCPEVDL